jgi:Domain of unknown function (DUF4262)
VEMMAAMCAICDGQSYEEALAEMHERIGRFGFTMTGIEPDPDHPGWIYTVGLVERCDHPELAILGVPLDFAYAVLTTLSRRVLDRGARVHAGELARVNGVDFHVGPVDSRLWEGDMFNQWWNYYAWRDEMGLEPPDLEPHALELVVCGAQRLPWQDHDELVSRGCEPPRP